jgi:hypothetical protein
MPRLPPEARAYLLSDLVSSLSCPNYRCWVRIVGDDRVWWLSGSVRVRPVRRGEELLMRPESGQGLKGGLLTALEKSEGFTTVNALR